MNVAGAIANRRRAEEAGSRTAEQAIYALAVLNTLPTPDNPLQAGMFEEYRQALALRVGHPSESLAELAGRAGLSKHAYAAKLRRALQRFGGYES